jgi:hypothetical protein
MDVDIFILLKVIFRYFNISLKTMLEVKFNYIKLELVLPTNVYGAQ